MWTRHNRGSSRFSALRLAVALLLGVGLGQAGCRAALPEDGESPEQDVKVQDSQGVGSDVAEPQADVGAEVGGDTSAGKDAEADADTAADADALADADGAPLSDGLTADVTEDSIADSGDATATSPSDGDGGVGDASPEDDVGPDALDLCKLITCNDNNPCTIDTCSSDKCVFTSQSGPCDDGNPCTIGDLCIASKCLGEINPCNDQNGCTDDTCAYLKGCTHVANAALCDDGDACSVGDACASGECKPGAPLGCDDKNVCTADSCDKTAGCVYLPNAATCDDGNNCSADDTCSGGACKGSGGPDCSDANACTDDGCEPSKGCTHANNDANCPDSDKCNGDEVCNAGACKAGQAPNCDDKNACTADSCDKAKGCVNLYTEATCSDGDACTTGDLCQNGTCTGKAPTSCDDKNACTDDSCDPKTGCATTANKASCDDGDGCTVGDTCDAKVCKAGAAKVCQDNNQCTVDSCISGACLHTLNAAKACDDGNACTVDACQGSSCVVSKALDDLSVCSNGMVCQAGACKAGWANSSVWSSTQNPNGVWTYGWATVASGSFPKLGQLQLYADKGPYQTLIFWYDKAIVGPDMVPSIFANTTSQPMVWLDPGQISLHPGGVAGDVAKPVYSVLRWKAPKSGNYAVKASFWPGDPGGHMVALLAIQGTATTQAPVLIDSLQALSVEPYLDQGATVDFCVGPNPTSGFKFGTTPVAVQIMAK